MGSPVTSVASNSDVSAWSMDQMGVLRHDEICRLDEDPRVLLQVTVMGTVNFLTLRPVPPPGIDRGSPFPDTIPQGSLSRTRHPRKIWSDPNSAGFPPPTNAKIILLPSEAGHGQQGPGSGRCYLPCRAHQLTCGFLY